MLATGSSTLGASARFRDTLAGRKADVFLTPMVMRDLPSFGRTDIEHRMLRRGLPPFFLAPTLPERDFQEWLDAYWAKDILELFLLEKRPAFQRLFELILVRSGGIFDASRFARDCGVSRTTIANYLSVLEATAVAHVVRPYAEGGSAEIVAAPRVFGFDTGFVCYHRGWNELRRDDVGVLLDALADELDAVYHCAARVDMVAPFAALAPHNLGATAEILRLCVRGRRKPLHHASTLSVLVATDRASGRLDEVDELDGAGAVFGGYAQSKWAAERLVRRASALPATVYRFGLITGDLDRGALPSRDFLTLLTRGLAALRAVPAAWLDALAIDVTPVGFAAAAMAAITLGAAGSAPGTYHIAGRAPVPLRAWVQAMRAAGVVIDEVSEEDWTARTTEPAPPGQPARADLARAIALLGTSRGAGAAAFAVHRDLDMFQATGVTFDAGRADAALRGTGLERPVATPALLACYVQRILENVT